MSVPNVLDIDESTSAVYTATLQDETGTVIPSAAIDSITMTLTEMSGGEVVNSRNAQDVLNANNCTMHATSGLFTWNVQPADVAITLSTIAVDAKERHKALITVVWNTTKKMHRVIKFRIHNLA